MKVWSERVGPSFYSIYGSDQDNVWMGGNDGKLYHFDGNAWSLSYKFNPEGFENAEITDVWGTSASDIYAIGNLFPEGESFLVSFILHYNGNSWEELIITNFEVQFQRVRIENRTPYIRAVKTSQTNPDTLLFYQYKQGSLQELLSKTKNEVQVLWMNNIANRIYFIIDNKIKLLKNGDLNIFYKASALDEIVGINGRDEKDIFIHTRNKMLHYNGQDLEILLEGLPNNVFRGKLFSSEVFFVIWDFNNGTNYIYHGTLTEEEE